MEFHNSTIFKYNFASVSGGALDFNSPKYPILSSYSLFIGNIAATKNGGAIDAHHGSWSSNGDRFESNFAQLGSGGAFASFDSFIHFDALTSCIKNKAPHGGGGCILWEPEASDIRDEKWKMLEPVVIIRELLFTGNDAAYGATLATSCCRCPSLLAPSDAFLRQLSAVSGFHALRQHRLLGEVDR